MLTTPKGTQNRQPNWLRKPDGVFLVGNSPGFFFARIVMFQEHKPLCLGLSPPQKMWVITRGTTWVITVNSAKTTAGSEFNKPQKAEERRLMGR
jgi:hypothetical protein